MRGPLSSAGKSKWRRYTQTASQADGSHLCQESGATQCGKLIRGAALSSKLFSSVEASLLPPNSQLRFKENICRDGPLVVAVGAASKCCPWSRGVEARAAAQVWRNFRRGIPIRSLCDTGLGLHQDHCRTSRYLHLTGRLPRFWFFGSGGDEVACIGNLNCSGYCALRLLVDDDYGALAPRSDEH